MKTIINGKKYDTETATTIAEWDNGLSISDFHVEIETLYRTAKGTWFLHGEGGALSSYGVQSPDGRSGSSSSAIVPYTPDDARQWLESRGMYDVLERFFGDDLEDA